MFLEHTTMAFLTNYIVILVFTSPCPIISKILTLKYLGVVTTSTCSSTISTNTTYIRNPGYPSTYTASSAGTCTYTINKISDDICQLRLDFQTFSGFATGPTTAGDCDDSFAAAGQTGKDPPSICGTNTGYHSMFKFFLGLSSKIYTLNFFAIFRRNWSWISVSK